MKRHASKGHMCAQSCGLFPLLKYRALPAVIHSVAFYLSEAERKSTSHLLVQSGQPLIAADGPSPNSHPPVWTLLCQSSLISHPLPAHNICKDKHVRFCFWFVPCSLFWFCFLPPLIQLQNTDLGCPLLMRTPNPTLTNGFHWCKPNVFMLTHWLILNKQHFVIVQTLKWIWSTYK